MGDEVEKESWAPEAFVAYVEGVERAQARGAGLVTDLWVLMIDRGDGEGELIVCTDDGTDSGRGMAMVSTNVEVFEGIDLAAMARGESATIRLRHFRACHDQGEFKP